jgi:hypothetical protein
LTQIKVYDWFPSLEKKKSVPTCQLRASLPHVAKPICLLAFVYVYKQNLPYKFGETAQASFTTCGDTLKVAGAPVYEDRLAGM